VQERFVLEFSSGKNWRCWQSEANLSPCIREKYREICGLTTKQSADFDEMPRFFDFLESGRENIREEQGIWLDPTYRFERLGFRLFELWPSSVLLA